LDSQSLVEPRLRVKVNLDHINLRLLAQSLLLKSKWNLLRLGAQLEVPVYLLVVVRVTLPLSLSKSPAHSK